MGDVDRGDMASPEHMGGYAIADGERFEAQEATIFNPECGVEAVIPSHVATASLSHTVSKS